jgi:hypothetical protein
MAPYWLRFVRDDVIVVGGDREDPNVLQEIESPYEARPIELRRLVADEYPTTDARRDALRRRQVPPGVYHQLGGMPIRDSGTPLICPDCSKAMMFGGIVDYDDSNVPLYEPVRRPVALIIGDGDCLHFFTCRECDVIGVVWQR